MLQIDLVVHEHTHQTLQKFNSQAVIRQLEDFESQHSRWTIDKFQSHLIPEPETIEVGSS